MRTKSYDLKVKYAMRITWSGEFVHAAPWNSANMGEVNASHGCVGMSTSDAAWLFNRVQVGDPVVTTGSGRGSRRATATPTGTCPGRSTKKVQPREGGSTTLT